MISTRPEPFEGFKPTLTESYPLKLLSYNERAKK